jgi:hypothetical protein
VPCIGVEDDDHGLVGRQRRAGVVGEQRYEFGHQYFGGGHESGHREQCLKPVDEREGRTFPVIE